MEVSVTGILQGNLKLAAFSIAGFDAPASLNKQEIYNAGLSLPVCLEHERIQTHTLLKAISFVSESNGFLNLFFKRI